MFLSVLGAILPTDRIWPHFPKAEGTSVEKTLATLFKRDQSVIFDKLDQNNLIWHHSLEERRVHDPSFDPEGRRVIANIRRLPSWILSRVHFEVQRSGTAGGVRRSDLVNGRFAVPVAGGKSRLYQADVVLQKFAPDVTHWVRMEKLAEDLAPAVGLEEFQVAAEMVRENKGKLDYIRDIPFWFTPENLKQLYAANPAWAELERRVYGKLWGE